MHSLHAVLLCLAEAFAWRRRPWQNFQQATAQIPKSPEEIPQPKMIPNPVQGALTMLHKSSPVCALMKPETTSVFRRPADRGCKMENLAHGLWSQGVFWDSEGWKI